MQLTACISVKTTSKLFFTVQGKDSKSHSVVAAVERQESQAWPWCRWPNWMVTVDGHSARLQNAHNSPQLERRRRRRRRRRRNLHRAETDLSVRLSVGLAEVCSASRTEWEWQSDWPLLSLHRRVFVRPWLAVRGMPQAAFTLLIRSRSSPPAQRWSESTASDPGRFWKSAKIRRMATQQDHYSYIRQIVTDQKFVQKLWGGSTIAQNAKFCALTVKYAVWSLVHRTIVIFIQFFFWHKSQSVSLKAQSLLWYSCSVPLIFQGTQRICAAENTPSAQNTCGEIRPVQV